jgi:hypothetical protein
MRCPVCRANNDRGPQCRRCRADLSLLFTLEEQRRRALAAAKRALARGQCRTAAAIASGVQAYRRDDEVERLLAIIHLWAGDFTGAWQAWRAAQAPGETAPRLV